MANGHLWTKAETDVLRRVIAEGGSAAAISRTIGRSTLSVLMKAERLGLPVERLSA